MILQYENGILYCDGYESECGEWILLDYEIEQGYCSHCQELKDEELGDVQ